jgi:hypothetical protein
LERPRWLVLTARCGIDPRGDADKARPKAGGRGAGGGTPPLPAIFWVFGSEQAGLVHQNQLHSFRVEYFGNKHYMI